MLEVTGRRRGGKPFARGALYRLLANRVYLGEAVHKGQAYPGAHQPIVDPALFAAVQDRLAAQGQARTHGVRANQPSLLGGLLFDYAGAPMSPSHAVKNHKRYRYYTSQMQLQERRRPGRAARVPAHEIEALVRAELQALLQDRGALLDLLAGTAPDLHEQRALLAADALRRLLHGDPAPSRPAKAPDNARVVLTVPAQLRRCGGETKLIVPGRSTLTAPARPNPALIKALVRAHALAEQLRSGAPQGLARILPLACLAPDITAAILDGAQPPDLTLARLRQPLPLAWAEQRRVLGLPAAGRGGATLSLSRDPPAGSRQHLADREGSQALLPTARHLADRPLPDYGRVTSVSPEAYLLGVSPK